MAYERLFQKGFKCESCEFVKKFIFQIKPPTKWLEVLVDEMSSTNTSATSPMLLFSRGRSGEISFGRRCFS